MKNFLSPFTLGRNKSYGPFDESSDGLVHCEKEIIPNISFDGRESRVLYIAPGTGVVPTTIQSGVQLYCFAKEICGWNILSNKLTMIIYP